MNARAVFLITMVAGALSVGCSGPQTIPDGAAPVEEYSKNAQVSELPAEVQAPDKSPESSQGALVALLQRAEQQQHAQQHSEAAASLERALRIEPRNAWIWHRLAAVRFAQKHFSKAISLAKKSNALAPHDRVLGAANWHLIEQVEIARGQPQAAQKARIRAEQLEP